MKKTLKISFITLMAVLLVGTSWAGAKDLLFCLPGFPGSSTQAQPYVDKMLRHIETKLGWEAGSMTGVYYPDAKNCTEKLTELKPGLALVGPSIYAGRHKEMGMKVIAKVEVQGRGEEVYSVITRKDGPATLAELAGKKVEGAVIQDAKYVYNVLLNNELTDRELNLVLQKRPLKALRDVARGKADAAIVDKAVVDHMGELEIAADLQVIYNSKPVPAPIVVVMGEGITHKKELTSVLVGMCSRPDSAELCKTLTISSIKPASDADFKKLLKAYNH